MAVPKKVVSYLDKQKYKYEIVPHRTTFTAWDTAQTEKVKPQEVAKALVLQAEKDWIVAVLPANKKLDKQKLLKVLNVQRKKVGEKPVKRVDFAKESWMKKNIPVGKLGAVPPFRGILKRDICVDNGLLRNKKIYVGSGEYEFSVRLSASQYTSKEKPLVGAFAVKRD